MWVIRYDGEVAVNLARVRVLRLKAKNGEMQLLADLDCAGESVLLAHGDPNTMYRLLEALVHNHGEARSGVFDIGKWAVNQQRIQGLKRTALDTLTQPEVTP